MKKLTVGQKFKLRGVPLVRGFRGDGVKRVVMTNAAENPPPHKGNTPPNQTVWKVVSAVKTEGEYQGTPGNIPDVYRGGWKVTATSEDSEGVFEFYQSGDSHPVLTPDQIVVLGVDPVRGELQTFYEAFRRLGADVDLERNSPYRWQLGRNGKAYEDSRIIEVKVPFQLTIPEGSFAYYGMAILFDHNGDLIDFNSTPTVMEPSSKAREWLLRNVSGYTPCVECGHLTPKKYSSTCGYCMKRGK